MGDFRGLPLHRSPCGIKDHIAGVAHKFDAMAAGFHEIEEGCPANAMATGTMFNGDTCLGRQFGEIK